VNFGGTPLEVLNLAHAGSIRLHVSDAILEEFGGVLRDKLRWREGDIADAQQEIRSFANHVTPAEALTVVRADPDDDRILECAAAARSDYALEYSRDVITHPSTYIAVRTEGSDCLQIVIPSQISQLFKAARSPHENAQMLPDTFYRYAYRASAKIECCLHAFSRN
jgi:uncharacterized protein